MRDFTRLEVWRRAHRLALEVYRATDEYPPAERFELRRQARSSATSVPTNIAEGAGCNTRADYARFVDIAAGSTNELEYQLILGRDLGYLDRDTARRLRDETRQVGSMLTTLTQRIAPDRA